MSVYARFCELLVKHKILSTMPESSIVEKGEESPHHAACNLLSEMERLDNFDLEGDFMNEGFHAREVAEILKCSEIQGAKVTDRWVPRVGRLIEVEHGERRGIFLGGSTTAQNGPFGQRDISEDPDDEWADPRLLIDAVRFVAEPLDMIVVSFETFDQGMMIGAFPRPLIEDIEASGIATTEQALGESDSLGESDEEYDDDDEYSDEDDAEENPMLILMETYRGTRDTEITEAELAKRTSAV